MVLEKYAFVDALYMTVITISTVGFGEVQTLTQAGKLFTSMYIIINLGLIAYLISVLTTSIFEGELKNIYNRFMIGREANKLKDHIIVCGFGRNGERAALELEASNRKFIVIEQNEEHLERLPETMKFNVLVGDATTDEILKNAGIERAKGIITTLPSDADNVFISLTAREANSSIYVVARASDESSEVKLKRAGANMVVMPDALGGIHMAHLITKPSVVEFLNVLNGLGFSEYNLEELHYKNLKPEYKNKSIKELDIRNKTGVSILAMKEYDGAISFSPEPETYINENNVMIVLGKKKDIANLRKKYTWD